MAFNFNKSPEITKYTVETERLPKGSRFIFAVIADLHECTFGEDNELLISALDRISPDGILIPGDLIEAGAGADPRETLVFLKKLKERYFHIFYSPGNHEHKLFEQRRFIKQMVLFKKGLKASGVSLLRDECLPFGDFINVYSLDLNHDYYRRIIKREIPEGMLFWLLGKPDRERFNILLAHDPVHFPEYVKWKPDLIISGHVHGGIIRLPKLGGLIGPTLTPFPKYDCGLYEKEGVRMIVSRGAGSHTIKLRINNPPEILKIVITGV